MVVYLCAPFRGIMDAHDNEEKIKLFCTNTARLGAVKLLKQLLQTALVTRHVRV